MLSTNQSTPFYAGVGQMQMGSRTLVLLCKKLRTLITISGARYNAVHRKVASLTYGHIPTLGTNLLHCSHHQLLHSCCVGGKHLNRTQYYYIPITIRPQSEGKMLVLWEFPPNG